MRHLLMGLVAAATTTLAPALVLAGAQDVAEQIGRNLHNSGQLRNHQISVKFQDGTAWLTGQVRDQEQMNAALKTASGIPEVTRVVNNLRIGSATPARVQLETRQANKQTPESTTLRFRNAGNTLAGNHKKLAPPAKSKRAAAPPTPLRLAGGISAPERFQRAPSTGQESPRPRRIGAATRLETVRANAARDKAMPRQAKCANHQKSAGVRRVASSFTPAPAKLIAAAHPAALHMTGQRLQRRPIPVAYMQQPGGAAPAAPGGPIPAYVPGVGGGVSPARYDQPHMPNYAWPSYASYPNYAGVTYPRQYSPTAWPYIGPFYPYPQVPLGWRKVTLEWHDGWWMLDFKD